MSPSTTQRKTMTTLRFPACIAVLLCVSLTSVKGDAAADLKAVQSDFFQWHIRTVPQLGTDYGFKKYNDRLTSYSLAIFDTQLADVREFIRTTQAIDRSQLDQEHQYSYDIFMDTLTTFANNYEWRLYGALSPVNFLGGFYQDLNFLVEITPFDTQKDFEDFITKLEAWPAEIDNMKMRMDKAIEMNTTYHNVSVRAVPDQISAAISISPQDSPLFRPFNSTQAPQNISQNDWNDMRSQALDAIQFLWTKLDGLKSYIENTYMPNTRPMYGVWGLPRGNDFYRACLKWHLSVDMSPEQVHQTGLREVDRITQLMRKVMTRQGFRGTVKEYYDKLNSDPRFQLNSAEEILEGYKYRILNRTYPKLPTLFKNIPSIPVVVKPLAYDGPFGVYFPGPEDGSRPGIFYVNLFRVNDTKTYTMMPLSLHETVPGHHLQGIYQMEAGLPDFQKYLDYSHTNAVPYRFPIYSAYVEGWALYSEYLGEEMGIYTDDYELMGRYGDEIFRACRLVIDTGLHHKGWSRDRAIQYLSERIPRSRSIIEIEINRYITWPGQACAYKIGELKIKELRKKAEREMGSKFDIRDFHSLLLTSGPAPLSVLETIVNDYITGQVSGTAACIHCVSASLVGITLLLPSVLKMMTSL